MKIITGAALATKLTAGIALPACGSTSPSTPPEPNITNITKSPQGQGSAPVLKVTMTSCGRQAYFRVANVSTGARRWAWIQVQFISKSGNVMMQNVGDGDVLSPGTHETVNVEGRGYFDAVKNVFVPTGPLPARCIATWAAEPGSPGGLPQIVTGPTITKSSQPR